MLPEPKIEVKKVEMSADGRMTIEETANFLSVKVNTLRNWIYKKISPPHFTIARRIYFYYDDVVSWLRDKYENDK